MTVKCPHCGATCIDAFNKFGINVSLPRSDKRIGYWRCRECRKTFTPEEAK